MLGVTGAEIGSPESVIVRPSCWNDICGIEKSAMIGPSEPSHCIPNTTSAPSMGRTKKGIVNVVDLRFSGTLEQNP